MSKKIRVYYTTHARDRMKTRGVSQADLTKTLNSPTTKSRVNPDNTQEFRRKDGGRTNYVVVEIINANSVRVITTGWS